MNRRDFASFTSLLVSSSYIGLAAAQATYPSGPVKVLVGFPPGTATDVAARAVLERMGRVIGQPFVVDNRTGASSNIAAKAVAGSAPDGLTLFVATIANAINSGFPGSTFVDLGKELSPVSLIGSVPNILAVHPSLPVHSLNELILLAKSKPGELSYASSGIGTAPHLSGELLCSMTGIKMLHVPYRGSTPAVTDVLAGQVKVIFAPASSVLPHIRAGKLRALGVTSAKRTAVAPDLPTLAELGLKGFETAVWMGFMAPIGTPLAVVNRLNSAAHASLDTPEVQSVFKAQGIDIVKSSPEEFGLYIRAESARWAKVIKDAGIKPE